MRELEKIILNEVQNGIPLVERPFLEIANKLNISEDEVIKSIKNLEDKNYIRRFGAILDVNKLGIVSTLICMKVEDKEIERVASIINEYEGVTHNYERGEEYNLWFTLMESSKENLEKTIKEIKIRTGIDTLLNLPSVKKYKTKVFFKFE